MTFSQTGQRYDVAIIGGGIAGLTVALRLPSTLNVALFTKGKFGESNTRYAQGGLSVALGSDDSPELHFQDTIAAGAGLCDEEAVHALVEQGPEAARWLMQMGVCFDRAQADAEHATADGLLLGREGAHSCRRVLHAGGDATGAEIERALMEALYTQSSIELFEETFVSELLVSDLCHVIARRPRWLPAMSLRAPSCGKCLRREAITSTWICAISRLKKCMHVFRPFLLPVVSRVLTWHAIFCPSRPQRT